MAEPFGQFVAVVPAAGVGKRMKSQCPKQYLKIGQLTVLEHTVQRLLAHPLINHVVIALGAEDEYFRDTSLAKNAQVSTVIGGKDRVDSVLAGLKSLEPNRYQWALVHDAARPCLSLTDIESLISTCVDKNLGGLLASPVRDTMKRSDQSQTVLHTEERNHLWHALTPQLFPIEQLILAIESGLANNANITDESSAIELAGYTSIIVEGSSKNIKITQPDDLAFAEFILSQQHQASSPFTEQTRESKCE
ncbi:2-C-methyl-D-erythritol 4-phosphate cytidylyltransferase [Thalassotalea sp. PLHSN55]|uniref:2-C-methyl-D-erythritol 4-phosphate cytidylyltransferase n=1 Tax=Thalassotalea sp. PLHSN55 TaxID=3435888 RepID=UPI003F866AF2